MGHKSYTFDFLATVSAQLVTDLEALPVSLLDAGTLTALAQYQNANNARQGVYLLHLDSVPVYLGKADNVADRLGQHLRKLSGRKNLTLTDVGYKALLLDKSMSTAANESVLIAIFRQSHAAMWNGKGFGPKDPGKERDTTRPSFFDRTYPIDDAWLVDFPDDTTTAAHLMDAIKQAVPYTFRFDLKNAGDTVVNLTGVPRTAKALLCATVRALGAGWKGAVLAYGMVLYRTDKQYRFGEELLP
ncbi:Eco29kI family restriction endonuclease [Pseudoxanthomonas japonensis]|uniref:Eco29kI family restriction endonuclease n=1 Tax=Pseudoxanthomonas japonensis TaxID=69284 RepID=UPI001BCBD1E5|nr:Eco29kI family restriction endonuclease [Pseudoxanthomonas japonensis]